MSEKTEWSSTFDNVIVRASTHVSTHPTGAKLHFSLTYNGRELTPEETRDAMMSMVWILNEKHRGEE